MDPKYDSLLQALMYSSDSEIQEEILKMPEIVESVTNSVFKTLKGEVKRLCSVSADNILRYNDKDSLLSFSFHTMSEEWKEKAPVFHRFLVTASDNPRSEQRNTVKRGGAILPGQISAGCKLLNTFNREMKALQNVNDLIFLKGGLKKSAFNRMKATGDCHSYKSAIDLADKLASKWNEELFEWQERNRRDNELEQELIDQIRYIQDTIQLLNSAGTDTSELVLEQAALQNWIGESP